MIHTYAINHSPYKISILNRPDLKKIPNHALTHYAHNIYPTVQNASKPTSAPAHRPMGKTRKIIAHTDRPAITVPIATTPTHQIYNPKPYRSKYRNNINKDALAAYFDNEPTPQEQWMADVIAELEQRDANRASIDNANNESLRQFVDASRAPNFADDPIYETNQVYVFVINLSDILPILLEALIATTPTQQKSQTRSVAHPEINAFIADRFVQKYHGADTATAMRTLDRQKRHKTKIQYILHQLQITK